MDRRNPVRCFLYAETNPNRRKNHHDTGGLHEAKLGFRLAHFWNQKLRAKSQKLELHFIIAATCGACAIPSAQFTV
jgi:hypothetical protein